jgi:hypothetical protein
MPSVNGKLGTGHPAQPESTVAGPLGRWSGNMRPADVNDAETPLQALVRAAERGSYQ